MVSLLDMASAFPKQHDYKNIAEKCSELNELQVEFGKTLVKQLGVKRGDDVISPVPQPMSNIC